VSLVTRSVVRELVAASGPFNVVWFTHDIVSYISSQGVVVSVNPVVNRAVIVIVGIMIASILTFPLGVLVSRYKYEFSKEIASARLYRRRKQHSTRL